MCRFNTLFQIPMSSLFFAKIKKPTLKKIIWDCKGPQTVKLMLNKNKVLTLPNYETYFKTIVISGLGKRQLKLGKDSRLPDPYGWFHPSEGTGSAPSFPHFMLMLAAALPLTGDIYCSIFLCEKTEMTTEKLKDAGWSQGLARWWRRSGFSSCTPKGTVME